MWESSSQPNLYFVWRVNVVGLWGNELAIAMPILPLVAQVSRLSGLSSRFVRGLLKVHFYTHAQFGP